MIEKIPTGIFIRYIHCHAELSTIKPPNVGPIIENTITANPNRAIATPLFSKGNAAIKIA